MLRRITVLGPTVWAVLLTTSFAGCGDDDGLDADGTTLPSETTSDAATIAGESSTGQTPTTGEGPSTTTTGDVPTTTTSDATDTDNTDTDDTDDTTDTDDVCEPGQPGCPCDQGTCEGGYVCEEGKCEEVFLCRGDAQSPGESEDTPIELDDITDDDDDAMVVDGILSGAKDVDWYRYHGSDTFGYVAAPTLELLGGSQRMCLFIECDNGGAAQTTVSCPDGTTFAISPKLRPGCCSKGSFEINDFNCPGNDESSQIWARIDQPTNDVCVDYSVLLHF